MDPKMPLAFLATRVHCWLNVNPSPTRTPRSLSAELLSSSSGPCLYWFMGLFLPRCSALQLPLLNLIRFLSAQVSSLSRSQWMAVQPFGVSATPPSLCHQWTSERKLQLFIQVIDEEVEQDWAKYWTLGDTSSYRPSSRLGAADDNPLSSTIQPVLNPPLYPEDLNQVFLFKRIWKFSVDRHIRSEGCTFVLIIWRLGFIEIERKNSIYAIQKCDLKNCIFTMKQFEQQCRWCKALRENLQTMYTFKSWWYIWKKKKRKKRERWIW